VTNVKVYGVVQSYKQEGVFTFKLPLGIDEIEVMFSGYQNSHSQKFKFTIIEVRFDKKQVQKELNKPIFPKMYHARYHARSISQIKTSFRSYIKRPLKFELQHKNSISLNLTYPEIDKTERR